MRGAKGKKLTDSLEKQVAEKGSLVINMKRKYERT